MARSLLLSLIVFLSLSIVYGQFSSTTGQSIITVPCSNPYGDCTYQGDGVGVEYFCTNNGDCYCGNAQICNCYMNQGDCNCGTSQICYCDANVGDCCYTPENPPLIATNYGDDWVMSDGVCYGDDSSGNGPMSITLIVVGVCLGVLLILLVVAAIIRRRRYYASLETNVVYSSVPTYGVAPSPYAYQVPQQQSAYAPQYPAANTAYYPTSSPYAYTASSSERR